MVQQTPALIAELFEAHMQAELEGDRDRTMETMTSTPHLNHVPVRAGGHGDAAVREFYGDHLVGKFFPEDVEFVNVSRTVDEHQLVDELLVSFTHTQVIDWMLPGVAPTGRAVRIPMVVIVRCESGKVSHEHIYWDQASVLVQIGLLSAEGLPVTGVEQSQTLADPMSGFRTEY